jgi:HSP20 family protein
LRGDIGDLLEQFWGDEGDGWLKGRIAPLADLSETETSVELKMDVPGVKPNEIDIQVNGNLLTVSGEHKEEKEEKGRTYHRIERCSGSFSRSVTLPCAVQEGEAAAECLDGILTITLPKAEEARTHKIKVKS